MWYLIEAILFLVIIFFMNNVQQRTLDNLSEKLYSKTCELNETVNDLESLKLKFSTLAYKYRESTEQCQKYLNALKKSDEIRKKLYFEERK